MLNAEICRIAIRMDFKVRVITCHTQRLKIKLDARVRSSTESIMVEVDVGRRILRIVWEIGNETKYVQEGTSIAIAMTEDINHGCRQIGSLTIRGVRSDLNIGRVAFF